eukprot:9328462-Alexandrium_andersonii.AAC.1
MAPPPPHRLTPSCADLTNMLVRAARAWCPLLKTVTGTVPQLPCGRESTPLRRQVLIGVLVNVAAIRRLGLRACSACVAHAWKGGTAHAAALSLIHI